jgi:hypothetical protein
MRRLCLPLSSALGNIWYGKTGSTFSNSGDATVNISGNSYSGPWIYSPGSGGYSLGNANSKYNKSEKETSGKGSFESNTKSETNSSASAMSISADGLINLRSNSGEFIRCIFSFNTGSSTGLGQCRRNDGKEYDLTIYK